MRNVIEDLLVNRSSGDANDGGFGGFSWFFPGRNSGRAAIATGQTATSMASTPATIVTQEKTTQVAVEDVNPQTRKVLLRLPDDTLVTLKVGPDVKNLNQLKPGDHVNAVCIAAKLVGINGTANVSGPIEQMRSGSGDSEQGPTTIIAVDRMGARSPL